MPVSPPFPVPVFSPVPAFSMPHLPKIAVLLLLAGCAGGDAEPLFVRLPPEATGIAFTNTLTDDPAFNIINYLD